MRHSGASPDCHRRGAELSQTRNTCLLAPRPDNARAGREPRTSGPHSWGVANLAWRRGECQAVQDLLGALVLDEGLDVLALDPRDPGVCALLGYAWLGQKRGEPRDRRCLHLDGGRGEVLRPGVMSDAAEVDVDVARYNGRHAGLDVGCHRLWFLLELRPKHNRVLRYQSQAVSAQPAKSL